MTSTLSTAELGGLVVTWLGGALLIEHAGGTVLVDAPPGVEAAVAHAGALRRLRAVVLTTGRMRSVGGLLGLLDAISQVREAGLGVEVLHPIDVEPAAVVADAWTRGWPGGVGISLDAVQPGHEVTLAGLDITFFPLELGEARGTRVVPVAGCGARLARDGVVVAWAPVARRGRALRRLCAGVDLAVVEVARRPWPEEGWRVDAIEAEEAAHDAAHRWLVGDDGVRLDDVVLDA